MAKGPDKIGKYKIIELLAQGGMGAVYKGLHPTLERPVILKKLTLRGNPDFAERFRREARILMDFRNDNIVDVYDHFKEGRSHYIVLEYIDGLSVEQLIQRERYLPNDMALYICYQTCKALKYAHNKNVIHRDIKPSNVLVSRRGEVKLLDFGIATSEQDSDQGLTREGMTLGSPAYMAPEQFENTRNVDKRADIYSLGVMLYEMVTGKKPFPGGFSADLVAAIQKGKYPPPQRYNPKASRMVRRIIRKCMRTKRRRRFQDLDDVLRILRHYFEGSDLKAFRQQLRMAVEGRTVEPVRRRGRSRIRSLAAALMAAAVLAGGGAALLFGFGYYYEWIEPDTHGEVSFKVLVDEGYKEPDEYYIRGWLFTDTGDNADEMDIDPLRFSPVYDEGGSLIEFATRPMYLPEDEYRVKIQAESSLYWKSFYLEPRTAQRETINMRDGMVLEFPYSPSRPLPLKVNIYVQDQRTWEQISDRTAVEIWWNDRWRPWSDWIAGELRTGTVYQFRFSAEGYQPKIFSLLIRPEQTTLYINPRLMPEE